MECWLHITEFIERVLRETPLTTGQIAGKLGQKRAALGDQVSRIYLETELLLYRGRQPGDERKARVELPIDKPGDAAWTYSRVSSEPGHAFEGVPRGVNHQIGNPIDDRPEGLLSSLFVHSIIAADRT